MTFAVYDAVPVSRVAAEIDLFTVVELTDTRIRETRTALHSQEAVAAMWVQSPNDTN